MGPSGPGIPLSVLGMPQSDVGMPPSAIGMPSSTLGTPQSAVGIPVSTIGKGASDLGISQSAIGKGKSVLVPRPPGPQRPPQSPWRLLVPQGKIGVSGSFVWWGHVGGAPLRTTPCPEMGNQGCRDIIW